MSFQICGTRASRFAPLACLLVLVAGGRPAYAQVSGVVRLLSTASMTVQGEKDTITAGVNWTAGPAATGTITVIDTVQCSGASDPTVATLGTITLGSATSASPGAGTLDLFSFPCTGQNLLVASYGGDANYSPGLSATLVETVLGQFTPTQLSLGSSPNPTDVGQTVVFSVQVTSVPTNGSNPSGTATFSDTSTGHVLGIGIVQTTGSGVHLVTGASMQTSSLAAGAYAVQAVYSGDSIYGPSTSQIVTQVIGPTVTLPSIQTGGVVSASEFGQFTSTAPGAFVEIHGVNLAMLTRSWAASDFQGVNAPTSLEGTSVTIGGQAAYISYISPNQVNAQVPDIQPGPQDVIVTTPAGSSPAYSVTVNAKEPGLLAPASLVVGGMQYAGALFSDGATFALPPGAVPAVASRRAVPGDVLTLYGVGFGPVTPPSPSGQIVQQSNTLVASLVVSFAGVPATMPYSGLAPQSVGLYEFNVVVPNVAASDLVPLTFSLDGVSGTQTLYVAVGN
jgi:uncharacterized protein (TIGR03437 family)